MLVWQSGALVCSTQTAVASCHEPRNAVLELASSSESCPESKASSGDLRVKMHAERIGGTPAFKEASWHRFGSQHRALWV